MSPGLMVPERFRALFGGPCDGWWFPYALPCVESPVGLVDQSINAGAWEVTVQAAFAGTELRSKKATEAGALLLEVDVIVLIIDDRSRSVSELLTLDGVTGLSAPMATRYMYIRDNRSVSYLEPGLPERVAFQWELALGTTVPKQLTVVVHGTTERQVTFQFLDDRIERPMTAATVTVPVTPRTVT